VLTAIAAAAAGGGAIVPYATNAGSSRHLTAGFSHVKLSESQFVVQKPYDVRAPRAV